MKTNWTLAESESQNASPHFKLRQHETASVILWVCILKYCMECGMHHSNNEGYASLSAEKNM